MCSECGMMRCPSGCPNAEGPEVVAVCSECGAELFHGDEAFKIGGEVYCEVCVFGAKIFI